MRRIKIRHNSHDDYMRQSKERQLQDNVEDIKNILEAERETGDLGK